MACNSQTYSLGIRNLILGSDRKQKFCILPKADVAGSLAGKYFVVHQPDANNTKHVFWMDDGVAAAPSVPNATMHAVEYLPNDSKSAIAAAIVAVMNPLAWVSAVLDGMEVECEMDAIGYAYEARDVLDPLKKTGFNIVVAQFGSKITDLGGTEGDVTMSITEELKDVTSPQTGTFILAQIRRGATMEVNFSLKDSSEMSIRRALNFYGGTIVTDDTSETISGYGTNNLFKSTDDVADQLILRPTALAADNDASQDFTLHKCKLKLGEQVFSSENEYVLPIVVSVYLDSSKSGFANLFSFGDASAMPSA